MSVHVHKLFKVNFGEVHKVEWCYKLILGETMLWHKGEPNCEIRGEVCCQIEEISDVTLGRFPLPSQEDHYYQCCQLFQNEGLYRLAPVVDQRLPGYSYRENCYQCEGDSSQSGQYKQDGCSIGRKHRQTLVYIWWWGESRNRWDNIYH